jgi:hypothetical protein
LLWCVMWDRLATDRAAHFWFGRLALMRLTLLSLPSALPHPRPFSEYRKSLSLSHYRPSSPFCVPCSCAHSPVIHVQRSRHPRAIPARGSTRLDSNLGPPLLTTTTRSCSSAVILWTADLTRAYHTREPYYGHSRPRRTFFQPLCNWKARATAHREYCARVDDRTSRALLLSHTRRQYECSRRPDVVTGTRESGHHGDHERKSGRPLQHLQH